jgi:replicative DNA helicase
LSWDEAAEKTVLGAILADNAVMPSTAGLEPSDLYAPKHRAIFSEMRRMLDRGDAVDLVTLRGALGAVLQSAGGVAYLASLMDGLPRVTSVAHWARIIRDHSARRNLSRFGTRLVEATERGDDPRELIDKAMGHLVQLSRRADPEGFLDNRVLARQALEEIEAQADAPHGILGLRTGLIDLDKKLQGIRAGQLGLICARLKNGKSILCTQIADNVAKETGARVAFFSREMSGKAITKRRLSAQAKVAISTLHEAVSKEAFDRRMGRLIAAFDWVTGTNVAINTTADTVPAMRGLCQQLRAEGELALVVVDYLQLVRGSERYERKDLEIAAITGDLKRLAIDLEVPVLAAVQLNRGPESRADKRPYISDAAGSDSIGRDCDWAVLIHRDPPPAKGEPPDSTKGLADLIIDANRDGYTGQARVRFNAHVQRFETIVQESTEWRPAEVGK